MEKRYYSGNYNFGDIFGDNKDGYKPSYLRDVTRVHYVQNETEGRRSFLADREDQFEDFFSRNFQDQIEARSIGLDYNNRERITREAVFEQANYNYTNSLLNNTGSTFNRLFNAFQTPDLFKDANQSAMFGREVLHEFTNYLKEPEDRRKERISGLPLPARELEFKFEQSIDRSVRSAQQSSRHINKDIADFQRRNASSPSEIDYWTGGGVTRGKRLLDNVDYINRPGILPAIGMLHDADSEFSINIYQLQNKPIIDYYTANLQSRAKEYRDSGGTGPKFKFNVMLAWNEELAQNEDSLRILGPNLIALRTFQALQKQYGDAITFNIQTNDKRNHTKLLFSDTGAYISTQNQTAPVGKSLYQAGSNYETGRYVRNLSTTEGSLEDRAEGKIYQQIRQVHDRMFTESGRKIMSTGMSNISGPVETYEMMKTSLDFLSNNRDSKMDFILDQVFLLQYDSLLFDNVARGEMGPEAALDRITNLDRKKGRYQSEIQKPLMLALIEGRATATVDVRNYKERVQKPIFTSLMQDENFAKSGYNLDTYLGVNRSLSAAEQINQLMRARGITDENRAIQLLAMSSGNIQTANVPRQHVKAAVLYRTDSQGNITQYLGAETSSSNRGLYSMAISDNETAVNNELGILHASAELAMGFNKIKYQGHSLSLDTEENTLELIQHSKNILAIKDDLTSRRVGQLQYTDVNNRAEYEKDVDRKKLTSLFNELDTMNKASGNLMTLKYNFDNQGPIALQVEVNSQLKYTFTALTSGDGNGFIYEINKSKVIGQSEFINQSGSNINLGFGMSVGVGQRATLSPIQTTMSMISSIALESEQIRLIKAPLIEYRENYAPGLESNTSFDTGMARYLLNLSGYGDKLTNDVLHKGRIDETSSVIGALTNLQARMRNADPTLDKVRQLAGIDINSKDRLENIKYLTKLIGVFAEGGTSGQRHKVLTGEGLPAGTPNLKSFMSNLFQSPEYADLLYDFINSQGDPLYRQSVTNYIKEVSTRVYDPYLNRTQVSTYGSTQAYRQRPLYGVTERRQGFADSINRANAETVQNLTKLGAFALAASPFEHDATSDLGRGSSLLYMPITGTGGSREKSGLEYSGYHNYGALHPYFQHKKIGTVNALDIIQDAGVGSILTRQGVADYNESIRYLGITVNPDDILGKDQDTKLLFNFDVRKKASQIPQRIKNVIGSRPTRELSEVYQNLIEGNEAIYRGIGGNFSQQVNSIEQLRSLYLTDLRNRVGDKANLIDDSYAVGIEEAGQIRATLSSDLAAVLESVREEINNEFDDPSISEATKREILRVRLLQADQSAHAVRGFIGSSKRQGDSVVLFQLSGAYSDYSILNPYFGGENGMRTTFTDRAVKGQKSSQISSQRLLGVNEDFNVANEILVKSGDFIKQNQETGLFHVYSFDNASGQYKPGQVISSRKEFTVFNNLIEAVSVNPTFGSLRSTSNAASFEGVDAIEILRDIRILEGGVDSNEIRVEEVFNRTQKGGGGGRQESLSGGLAKMVPIYLYDQADGKDGLLRTMFNQFNKQRAGSFGAGELDFHQFYGVVNPSNLKSYFYEHGAKILIDQSKRTALLGSDAKHLAASLLMAFGTNKFGESQIGDKGTLALLANAAKTNKLGTFYKDQYVMKYLKSKGGSDEVIGNAFIKSVATSSNLQVRTLQYIGLDLIAATLGGDPQAGEQLRARLDTLLSDPTGNAVKMGEYVDIGKDRGRELSILAASIDYFVQLTKATPHDIAVFDATQDSVAYRSLGTIGGATYDELNKEELQNLVNHLGRRSYVVGMNMSMSASQSKVAISSKLDSFIENQHIIWEPFYTDAKKFKGGSLSSLRHLMAGFFGAMTGTHTGQFQNSVTGLQQIDILSSHARGAVFKASMLGVYNDPGVGDTQFKELQRNYEMFETLASIAETGDAALVRKIIEVYRKNSDGLDIEPGKLNKHLADIIEAADAGNTGRLNQLVEQGRYYAFNHFERMYADFRLDPNHRTNAGQAISSGLQRSAGSMGRFAFSMPHLEFSDDGAIKVYKDTQEYSFSLAGEDMKIIGESFGNVDNPLQKSQAILWKAMAPGSTVSKFLDRVAADNTGRVINVNDLSEEDYNEISKFYTTATLMPDELTDALGVFANKTMGGSKVGFAGGTTTPAAWFMGSTTATILPEAILARHGGGDSNRMRVHQSLVSKFSQLKILQNDLSGLYSKREEYYEERTFVEESEEYQHLQRLYSFLNENKERIAQIESTSDYIKLQQLYNLRNSYKDNKTAIETSVNYQAMQGLYNVLNQYKSNRQSIENSEHYVDLQSLYDKRKAVRSNIAEIGIRLNELRQSTEATTYVTQDSELRAEKVRLERELQPYWDLITQFTSEKKANKNQLSLIDTEIKSIQKNISPYLNERDSYTNEFNKLGYTDKKGNILIHKSVEDSIYSDYFNLIKEYDTYASQIKSIEYQTRRLGRQTKGLTYEINKLSRILDTRRLTPYQNEIYSIRKGQLIEEVNRLNFSMSELHVQKQSIISELQIFKADIFNPLMYERDSRLAELPVKAEELHNLIVDIDFQIHPQLEQIRELQQQEKDLLTRNRQINNELNELKGNKINPGFISSQEESLQWINKSLNESKASWKGSSVYAEIQELNSWLDILNRENSSITSDINVYRGTRNSEVPGFIEDNLLLLEHYKTQIKILEDRLNYYRGQQGEVYGLIENDILLQKYYSQKIKKINNEINKLIGNEQYIGTISGLLNGHSTLKAENKLLYSLIEARKSQSAGDFEWYSKVKEEILQINKEINEWVNPSIAQLGNNIEAGLKIDSMTQKKFLTSAINTLKRGISGEATAELNTLLKRSLEFKTRIEAAGSEQSLLSSIISEIEGELPSSKQSIGYYRNQLNIRTVKDAEGNKKTRMGAKVRDGGDSFVHLLGLYEMRALRAMALERGGFQGTMHSIADDNKVAVDSLIEQANTYKSLISPIDGLLVGVNNREGSIYVTPEELAGEMRRGSSKLESSIGLTHKHIAGLEGEAGANYLKKILDGIDNFARQEEARLNEKYKDTNAEALIKGTLTQLNEMRSMLDNYKTQVSQLGESITKYDVADLALLIQTDVERYHTELMLGSDQAMRPMPMGNSYSGRAIYDVYGLTNLNNLMSEYGLPISFTPLDGTNNRNKTLHLFNPYSWLVAHGGDFDGDMITNMFRTTSQMKLKANAYDALIENINSKINEAKDSLNLAISEDNEDKQTEINKNINDLTNRKENFVKQQNDLKATINNINKHESVTEYQKAAANWVGNYLKVDSRVFLGKDLGGFRNDGDSLPPEVLFTFTEQGRGLFGAMEGVVSNTKDLFNDLNTIANKTSIFTDLDNIESKLNDISDTNGLRQLLSDPNLSPEFVRDLQDRIRETGNVEAGIAVHIANLYASQAGAEAIQKYNLKGIDGASMTPAIFEAMEHTLGQAGSVILGKSYNTMVGMLYTEAPTLTMSYAVLNDDGTLENLITKSQGEAAWIRLKEAALESRAKSEGMGSFLQSTQQILRDSIKPKDAVGYLSELEDALQDYRNAGDEEGRSLAYKSIVEKFGPGKGLKALIEMESLVLDSNILNYRGDNATDLLNQKQTLEKYELTEQRIVELEQRLGYDSRTGEYTKLDDKINKQIKQAGLTREYVLAAYKTKQDMVSVVSDFAFDKGLNLGGSTGASMLDAFVKGREGLGQTYDRIKELTTKSEEYASKSGQERDIYLAGLDPESQAFIESLTHRGLGKLEGLTEGEQKFNELWDKKLGSRDMREYAAHTWMETNKQFGYTVGEYGEMFIRFGAFNQARREAYASNENLRETYYGLDDPLAVAQMMAMTNDKVEPSLIGNLFNSLANAARQQTGNANPTIEEIYKGIAFGAGLNETDSDVTMRTILQGGGSEAAQKVTEHLMGVASSMSTGQQTASVKDFLNSSQQQYVQALSEEVLTRHYVEKGFSPEEATVLASNSMNTYKTSTGTITGATFTRPTRNNNISKALNSLGKDADVKAQGFIFPMLGLIGAALSTGDLTPEAFQMAAGTALHNMSYVRWSNLENNYAGTAANVMAGTAFKMRLALEQSEGDAGKALVAATTRELTMAATAVTVNSFLPKYVDRMLGGGETLDFDKYQSGRTLITSTVSAVASTMLGMLLNNQVVNRMVSPDASYVTKELNAIAHQNKLAFHTNQEESEEDIPVEGDDGILDSKVFQTWANEDTDDYQIGMDVSEAVNFTFYNQPNTVYEFQLD